MTLATILAILANPTVQTLLVAGIGGAITLIQATKWWQSVKAGKLATAANAVVFGVQFTAQTYVDAIKKASADGTLTPEEEKASRDIATAAAIEYGKTHGIDLLQVYGPDLLWKAVEVVVARLKPSNLPADVVARLDGAGL